MCFMIFSVDFHENYPFLLVHNRDEAFNRETADLHAWKPSDQNEVTVVQDVGKEDGMNRPEFNREVIGGRDMRRGGTWLGMTKVCVNLCVFLWIDARMHICLVLM